MDLAAQNAKSKRTQTDEYVHRVKWFHKEFPHSAEDADMSTQDCSWSSSPVGKWLPNLTCLLWGSLSQAVGARTDQMPWRTSLGFLVLLGTSKFPSHRPPSTLILCFVLLVWACSISIFSLKPRYSLINPWCLLVQIHFLPNTNNQNPHVPILFGCLKRTFSSSHARRTPPAVPI